MEIIEMVRWKPSADNPKRREYAGQRTAEEVFQELRYRLESQGYLPEESFLLEDTWKDGREIPEDADIFCLPEYGECEGVYLDVYLKWYKDNDPVTEFFIGGKTLGENGNNLDRMFLISSAIMKAFYGDRATHTRYAEINSAEDDTGGMVVHLSQQEQRTIIDALVEQRERQENAMSQTEQLLRRMTGSITEYINEVGMRPLRMSDYDKAVLAIRDGENSFFYDSAEGLLTSVILLLAEFLPPKEIEGAIRERRHIVSVFKLVQDLLEPATGADKGKSQFQVLMNKLPSEHKARWFAGAALNTSEQAMASVLSTVLSRLNAFLDSELEQVLCFESSIDAESFASRKSAIFLILPEEDPSKNFMAGLMIQNMSRELFAVADENGGKLKNRVVFFCDELGTMPPFDILPLFSAGRSRKLTLVPIIQSLAQLEKNYGKEGAEIIVDNTQDTIFGGFAPQSQTAEVLSKALGNQTVQSGSISKGKGEASRSLQMVERPLMTPDELKAIPKGSFVVMKTGTHPMQTKLRLFLDWEISFGVPYQTPEHGQRRVYYADRRELEESIRKKYPQPQVSSTPTPDPIPQNTANPRAKYASRPSRRAEGGESAMRP